MRRGVSIGFVSLFMAAVAAAHPAAAARPSPLRIVAAENFYGDIARQIGGRHVVVSSILRNPDADPHLFEASPSVARDLTAARIVIANGVDYDPWMDKLLAATPSARRQVIVAAVLMHRKPGDNPHLWYDPATMPVVAKILAADLAAADPAHRAFYAARLRAFDASLQPLLVKVAAMRAKFAGASVTATEPVFGYMAVAIGLRMRNARFQLAVMNNTEPGAGDVAAFETDLRRRAVKVLIYNAQASDPVAERMMRLARRSHVPIVGVSETEPPGTTYQVWMLHQLNALDRALSGGGP